MDFLYDLLDQLQQFVLNNLWFAPLSAVLLPFIEALIPSLPLTILISFNLNVMASAYGTMNGTIFTIILSTLGSFLGMLFVFGIIRLTLAPYFAKKVEDNKYGKKFLNLVNGPNIWLVLILLSNPFLPSSILNYALSLTK
ncbi:MAG: VTT domain-containing protein, partial [Candidatus Izemoplasmatales bacterium]|nr:VTT domain-containing protein [Candidatus Izemoplasmatales bacterium]